MRFKKPNYCILRNNHLLNRVFIMMEHERTLATLFKES